MRNSISRLAASIGLGVSLLAGSLVAPATAQAAFMIMGLLNNLIPFSLIFWGQTQIASGLASILTQGS